MLDEGIEKRSEFVPFSSKMGQEPNLQTGSGQNVPAPAGSGPQHCKYMYTNQISCLVVYIIQRIFGTDIRFSNVTGYPANQYLSGASHI